MNKGKGSINEYKGVTNSLAVDPRPAKDNLAAAQTAISESALVHTSLGEYNTKDRPTKGGHGQEAIDYLKERGYTVEENIEYNNGVRAGNIPNHTQRMFHSGNRHTWFPKSWTRNDIKAAGEYVANQYPGTKIPRTHYSAMYKGVKVTVVFGEHGEIKTIFPAADQPGGKKK